MKIERSDFSLSGWSRLNLDFAEDDLRQVEALFPEAGAGRRYLGSSPEVRGLPVTNQLLSAASALLEEDAVPVRAILFVKSQHNNWLVPWHQDVTIASPVRFEREGYSCWSRKDGIWHAQPPAEVLEEMVALRLHLDDCGEEDGPLRVVPGSHACGRLSAEEVSSMLKASPFESLTALRREVLAMRPLLLHSSPKATGTSQRRVFHLECCAKSACPVEILAQLETPLAR